MLTVLIWFTAGVAQVAALVFLVILFGRVREATYDQWYAKQREHLIPDFFRFLCHDIPLGELRRIVGGAAIVAEDLILTFLRELADGESRVLLIQLADELGLLRRSLRHLHSLSWTVRDVAAMRLGVYALKETVPELAALLRDRRVEVRYTAARSLGLIGSPEAVDALVQIMDHPELLDTPRVLEIVHSMGAQASEPLKRLLTGNSRPAEVKLLAIDLIGDLREYSMVGDLHDIMRVRGGEQALRAVRALGKLSAPQSTVDIVRLMHDHSWELRAQAARAIGLLQIDEGIPQLVESLSDQSYWVRRNAAVALVQFGDRGVVQLLEARFSQDAFARDVSHYQVERLNGSLDQGLLNGALFEPATAEAAAAASRTRRAVVC